MQVPCIKFAKGNTGSRKVTSGTQKVREDITAEREKSVESIPKCTPVQVTGEQQCNPDYRGRWRLQSKPVQGREKQQCLNRTEGGQG